MTGFLSCSEPMRTERSISAMSRRFVPADVVRFQHRTSDTGSDVTKNSIVASHRHYAAVTAAEAAAHDPFNRDLARAPVLSRGTSRCGEHALRAAGMDHHRRCFWRSCEPAIE